MLDRASESASPRQPFSSSEHSLVSEFECFRLNSASGATEDADFSETEPLIGFPKISLAMGRAATSSSASGLDTNDPLPRARAETPEKFWKIEHIIDICKLPQQRACTKRAKPLNQYLNRYKV